MRLGMATMIVGGLLIVSLIAMGLTVFINLHKFDAAFSETVNDRFYFVLEDARDTIEGEMQLGQTIEKLKSASAALSSAKEIDPYILSIEVFNKEGRTLYSTDNSFLYDIVPQSWEKEWHRAENGRWELAERDSIVLGVGLQDMLSHSTGSLVLRYSSKLHETTFNNIKSNLIKTALWLWGGATLIMIFMILYLTKPLKYYFFKLQTALDSIPEKNNANFNNNHIANFMKGYQSAEKEVVKLENSLRKMDELEK